MWAAVAVFLRVIAAPLAGIVLKSLGIGVVTFAGVSAVLSSISNAIKASYMGAPASVVQVMSLLGFDHAISIIIAAVTVRLTLNGLDSATGSLKMWSRK
jgi:hypothetical protein